MQEILIRFAIDIVAVMLIIHALYYRRSRRADYYFTFAVTSMATFCMMVFLAGSTMGTGFALGLFAIFSIIRYRTELMPVREMTYLFALIAISVINALADVYGIAGLVCLNVFFVAVIAAGEMLRERISVMGCKYVKYDRIDLIRPECRDALLADLGSRLGVEVRGVDVGSVDFLKDMAILRVHYVSPQAPHDGTVDEMTKIPE